MKIIEKGTQPTEQCFKVSSASLFSFCWTSPDMLRVASSGIPLFSQIWKGQINKLLTYFARFIINFKMPRDHSLNYNLEVMLTFYCGISVSTGLTISPQSALFSIPCGSSVMLSLAPVCGMRGILLFFTKILAGHWDLSFWGGRCFCPSWAPSMICRWNGFGIVWPSYWRPVIQSAITLKI